MDHDINYMIHKTCQAETKPFEQKLFLGRINGFVRTAQFSNCRNEKQLA